MELVKIHQSNPNIYVLCNLRDMILIFQATYECHVNSDPPQKVAIHLFVKGNQANNTVNLFLDANASLK